MKNWVLKSHNRQQLNNIWCWCQWKRVVTTFLKGNSTCSIWDTHGKIENPSENISNSFFEDQPKEICSHLREKASKGRFLKPKKLQHHTNEGKGNLRRKKRARRREKSNGFTRNGPFGDNVFKTPTRHSLWQSHKLPFYRFISGVWGWVWSVQCIWG